MKKSILCIFIFVFVSSLSASTDNHNSLSSIEIGNYKDNLNYVELRITIADDDIGNVSIFNIKGQKLSTAQYASGEHRLLLRKSQYGSGLFFYKMKTNSYFKSGKIIMLK